METKDISITLIIHFAWKADVNEASKIWLLNKDTIFNHTELFYTRKWYENRLKDASKISKRSLQDNK